MLLFNKDFPHTSVGNFRPQGSPRWDSPKPSHVWVSGALILNIWVYQTVALLYVPGLTSAKEGLRLPPGFQHAFLDTISFDEPWSKKHKCRLWAMKHCFRVGKGKSRKIHLTSKLFTSSSPSSSSSSWQLWSKKNRKRATGLEYVEAQIQKNSAQNTKPLAFMCHQHCSNACHTWGAMDDIINQFMT